MGHGGVDLRDTDAVYGVTGVKPLAEQLDEYRNLVNRELERAGADIPAPHGHGDQVGIEVPRHTQRTATVASIKKDPPG